MKNLFLVILLFLLSCPLYSNGQENNYVISFDETVDYDILKGKAQIVSDGHKGKALCVSSATELKLPITLKAGAKYSIVGWLKTSSGADNISLNVEGLGKYNTGVSSALANWTKVELTVNVPKKVEKTYLCIVSDKSVSNDPAFIDEITISKIGTFEEPVYIGIPPRKSRELKCDLGIRMQPDEKIKWMLDDKLGMFIHWGLYAGPAKGEWYMERNGILPEEYRKLAYPESGDCYFTAKDFDANKWVELAKKAGMRYMNMVTQHHDGYALFESKYMNAFTSKQTHNRDFVKEYVEACRRVGLKVGLYKTLINWRFPGYYDVSGKDCKPNRFGYVTDSSHKENARLMKEELYCQVKELMTNYGRIDQLFWDGGWLGQKGTDADAVGFWESGQYLSRDNTWPLNYYFIEKDDKNRPLGLMGMIRKFQPDIVVNPRSGWCGDYTCEEGAGAVRGEIRDGVVEKCISLAPGWGYNQLMLNPDKIMPLNKLKRFCADCMVRNMCFLVNVGPDRHGNIPFYIEQRLIEFGEWVSRVSEAVYGTRGGPWNPVDGQYGFTYKDNYIYVYFLGGYFLDYFELPPLDSGMKALKAYDLYSGKEVNFKTKKQIISLEKLNLKRDDITIIAIELNRAVYED